MIRMIAFLAALGLVGLLLAQVPEPGKPPAFELPEIISTVEAPYPANSIAAGTVIFEVALNASGEIEGLKVVRHIPSLTQSAERALRKWKFKPARLDGKPVPGRLVVAFSFTRPFLAPTRPPR